MSIDDLPNIGLEELSLDIPLLIHVSNKIHFVRYTDLSKDRRGQSASSFVEDGRREFELFEAETLRAFETRYLTENEKRIKELISREIQQGQRSLEIQVGKESNNLFALRKREAMIAFIWSEVFTHYFDRQVPNPKAVMPPKISSLLNILQEHYQRQEPNSYKRLLESPSLLEQVLGRYLPMFIINGSFYKLVSNPSSKTPKVIYLDDQTYFLMFSGDIKTIEEEYRGVLQLRIRKLASEDESLKELKKRVEKNRELQDILNRSSYMSEEGIGFLRDENDFYVVRKIPTFALRDEEGNLYGFNECTVAVRLVVDENNRVTDWEQPIVLEEYSHPFLMMPNESRQDICLLPPGLGGFTTIKSRIIKQSIKANNGKRKIGHEIYSILDTAVNTIEGGYFGRGATPFRSLSREEVFGFGEEYQRAKSNPRLYRRITNTIKH